MLCPSHADLDMHFGRHWKGVYDLISGSSGAHAEGSISRSGQAVPLRYQSFERELDTSPLIDGACDVQQVRK